MKLTELLKNLDDDSLKLLAKFDKGIEKKVGAEKKAILPRRWQTTLVLLKISLSRWPPSQRRRRRQRVRTGAEGE